MCCIHGRGLGLQKGFSKRVSLCLPTGLKAIPLTKRGGGGECNTTEQTDSFCFVVILTVHRRTSGSRKRERGKKGLSPASTSFSLSPPLPTPIAPRPSPSCRNCERTVGRTSFTRLDSKRKGKRKGFTIDPPPGRGSYALTLASAATKGGFPYV